MGLFRSIHKSIKLLQTITVQTEANDNEAVVEHCVVQPKCKGGVQS